MSAEPALQLCAMGQAKTGGNCTGERGKSKWTSVHLASTMRSVNALWFGIGILLGLAAGSSVAIFLSQRAKKETQSLLEALAARTLQQQTEHILQLAESKLSGKKDVIDGTLVAMKDELKRVEELMKSIGSKHVEIDTRLGNAATVIKELSDTTGSLRAALSSNAMRGQWGERMAEDVLRLSGMIEGINYVKQQKLSSGSRPDFTFLLPNNLRLNMDVKFPFNNYQALLDASTETDKEAYRKKFLKDVRDRLKEVQTKEYINPEDQTVDYVLLFVPNEQIFSYINEMDRELIDEAMRGRTILCSPLSLYAILAVIRQSIDNFNTENASREMLSHFGTFRQQWEKFKEQMHTVKTRLESAQKSYDDLTGARERQLDRQLAKIEELRTQRSIPLQEPEKQNESSRTDDASWVA